MEISGKQPLLDLLNSFGDYLYKFNRKDYYFGLCSHIYTRYDKKKYCSCVTPRLI